MSKWTEDRVNLLKELWGEGKTAKEIAQLLGGGLTRNAVIGKAHRMKLSGRVSPIQQNKTVAQEKKEASARKSGKLKDIRTPIVPAAKKPVPAAKVATPKTADCVAPQVFQGTKTDVTVPLSSSVLLRFSGARPFSL